MKPALQFALPTDKGSKVVSPGTGLLFPWLPAVCHNGLSQPGREDLGRWKGRESILSVLFWLEICLLEIKITSIIYGMWPGRLANMFIAGVSLFSALFFK